jgi:hypothetical protein
LYIFCVFLILAISEGTFDKIFSQCISKKKRVFKIAAKSHSISGENKGDGLWQWSGVRVEMEDKKRLLISPGYKSAPVTVVLGWNGPLSKGGTHIYSYFVQQGENLSVQIDGNEAVIVCVDTKIDTADLKSMMKRFLYYENSITDDKFYNAREHCALFHWDYPGDLWVTRTENNQYSEVDDKRSKELNRIDDTKSNEISTDSDDLSEDENSVDIDCCNIFAINWGSGKDCKDDKALI